jgi:signal transduction histidine kinase
LQYPSTASARPQRSPEEATLWIGCLAALGVLWTAIVVVVVSNALDDRREREALAASTAKGFSEYVGLHLMVIDRVLQASRDTYTRTGAIPPHDALTADLGPIAPMLLQIAVADAQGRVVASSLPLVKGVDIADRPHFLAAQRDPRNRPFLSEPVVGRVSRKMSLQLVRPLLGPAGEFRGIIVASIDPLQLQEYFRSVDAFTDHGNVIITGRTDGVVRTMFEADKITWGQSLGRSRYWQRLSTEVAGQYVTVGSIHGDARVVGFHRVPNYPLVVAVSSRQPGWLTAEAALALALGVALTWVQLRHVRLRVCRLRAKDSLIEQLEKSRETEMQANRMKSRFLASVSHELRTPLNAILGFSELIRDMPDDPQRGRRAELIHSSGQHLHKLLNTLLDLAKIEAGRMELRVEAVDLADTVRTQVEVHAACAAKKDLAMTLACELPDGCVALADTDRTKLVQVLNNVLSNAVKFTPQGSVQVAVRVEDTDFVIQVDDSGRGIPPQRLARIFERFSTASTPGTAHEEGTGLGLALSRDLMRLLGGSIDLSSRAGGGTRALIRLPGVRLAEVQA